MRAPCDCTLDLLQLALGTSTVKFLEDRPSEGSEKISWLLTNPELTTPRKQRPSKSCDLNSSLLFSKKQRKYNKHISPSKADIPHLKMGTHCVHMGSASTERFSGSVKTYIHEIDALVSLNRSGCFALEKKNHAKTVTS